MCIRDRLCTYPRTDSRYLTDDMEGSVPGLVAAAAAVCGMEKPQTICAKQERRKQDAKRKREQYWNLRK